MHGRLWNHMNHMEKQLLKHAKIQHIIISKSETLWQLLVMTKHLENKKL